MINPFKNRKVKTISLQYFAERIREIANGEYYSVDTVLSHHQQTGREPTIELKAYIHGYNWVTGKTIEECVAKLQAIKNPPPPSDLIDVTEIPVGAESF